MAALTVSELDEAIDALALGAESWTLPSGVTVRRTSLDSLMKLRELRKNDEAADGGIVAQYVEFER